MIPPGTPLGPVQVALPGAPVIGQVAPAGQRVHLGSFAGWWDPTPTTGTTTQRVNDHGAHLGPAYYGPRIITLLAYADGYGPADSMALAQQIIRAVPLDGLVDLTVTDDTETLTARVRQEGDPLLTRNGNRVAVSLSLLAPDPRRYGPTQTAETGLAASTGGLTLPLVLPLTVNATSTAGVVNMTNTGDLESFPVFTITGPCAPFTITDVATGRQIAYQDTVPAGRQLVINTANRAASLDGTVRVLTGSWPRLLPGPNQFLFNAAAYDPLSRLTVTYRSARR